MPWPLLAPLLALVTTAAFQQLSVLVTGAVRARDYRRFEDRSREAIAGRYPLPASETTISEDRLKATSLLLAKSHRISNEAQTVYHNAVVRSASCLALAFLSLALSTVYRNNLLLGWIDFVALLAVIALFFYGRRRCSSWIVDRSGTELLRQYQYLQMIFPDAKAKTVEVETRFESEVSAVRAQVMDGDPADIALRIEAFWKVRRASLAARDLKEEDLAAEALLVYLRKRAVRQLGWFSDSKARLEYIAERRTGILLSLYVGTFALAVVKHALLVAGHADGSLSSALGALLLVATGISAAMTAYYFNQNLRSLVHRYYTQQRSIAAWLQAFGERVPFGTLASFVPDAAARNDLRQRILAFEDFMIEELIDWIHITTHDAIELAP